MFLRALVPTFICMSRCSHRQPLFAFTLLALCESFNCRGSDVYPFHIIHCVSCTVALWSRKIWIQYLRQIETANKEVAGKHLTHYVSAWKREEPQDLYRNAVLCLDVSQNNINAFLLCLLTLHMIILQDICTSSQLQHSSTYSYFIVILLIVLLVFVLYVPLWTVSKT